MPWGRASGDNQDDDVEISQNESDTAHTKPRKKEMMGKIGKDKKNWFGKISTAFGKVLMCGRLQRCKIFFLP